MKSVSHVVELLTKAEPVVLVAIVCIVALLVVAYCVKTLGENKRERG